MNADAGHDRPLPGGAVGDGARETGPALETWYRFLLWLVPAVERFPRRQRFLLGDGIRSTALSARNRSVKCSCRHRMTSSVAAAAA